MQRLLLFIALTFATAVTIGSQPQADEGPCLDICIDFDACGSSAPSTTRVASCVSQCGQAPSDEIERCDECITQGAEGASMCGACSVACAELPLAGS